MRKAFNFYRSYFDVVKELSDKDKLAFLMALIERQFHGTEPKLSGMAKFAYISQKHNIDDQVAGFEAKTKTKLTPYEPPTQGGGQGGSVAPSVQEKEKEKEEYVPELFEFLEYCKSIPQIEYLKLEFSITAKYEAWVAAGWRDGNNKKIKNWKTKIKNTIPFLKPMQSSTQPELLIKGF